MLLYLFGFFLRYTSCKSTQTAQQEIQKYECISLNFILEDLQAIVKCNKSSMIIPYIDFQKYQFINNNCPVIINLDQNHIYSFDYIMNSVLPSLKLSERRDILFTYYDKLKLLEPYIRIIPYENVEFWMYVNESDGDRCSWENSTIFDYYYPMIEYSDWRMSCYNNYYMFHLNNNNEIVEESEMPEDIGLIMTIVLLSFIPIMIIINLFIALSKNVRVSAY